MNGTLIRAGLVVVAVATIIGASYSSGAKHERERKDADIARLKLAHGERLAAIDRDYRERLQAATDKARAAEAKAAADMAAIDRKYTKELNDAKKRSAADVAAVRAGDWRVRESLTCKTIDVPTAAGPTRMGDGAASRGLGNEDAAEAIADADEGDRWAIQLKACQAIVMRDRASAKGALQP
jgi:hypothetical protein